MCVLSNQPMKVDTNLPPLFPGKKKLHGIKKIIIDDYLKFGLLHKDEITLKCVVIAYQHFSTGSQQY